jgi:hypothetical protein
VQRQQAAENMQKRPDRVPETGKSAQKQQEGRGSWLFGSKQEQFSPQHTRKPVSAAFRSVPHPFRFRSPKSGDL